MARGNEAGRASVAGAFSKARAACQRLEGGTRYTAFLTALQGGSVADAAEQRVNRAPDACPYRPDKRSSDASRWIRCPTLVIRGTLLARAEPMPDTVAGVDLGSNSFHMIVARVDEGQLHIVDRMRERVRLASGLGSDRRLSDEAIERGLACLTRFGQRVRELPPGSVRAAGTNTLRQAKNASVFLERAREALGHPIDVIAGREEARLIYLGVAHGVPNTPGRRLVIDIGGGST